MIDQPTYIQDVADRIGEHVPDCPHDLRLFYALLALATGVATTRENVHDAWAAWRTQTRPDHLAIVPYDDLTPEVQMLDEPYTEAIRQVAGLISAVPVDDDPEHATPDPAVATRPISPALREQVKNVVIGLVGADHAALQPAVDDLLAILRSVDANAHARGAAQAAAAQTGGGQAVRDGEAGR